MRLVSKNYIHPLPEWIIKQDFGEQFKLMDGFAREWFEDCALMALKQTLLKHRSIVGVAEQCNDLIVTLKADVSINFHSRDVTPMIDLFPQGFYGAVDGTPITYGCVTSVDYSDKLLRSYNCEGVTQKVNRHNSGHYTFNYEDTDE